MANYENELGAVHRACGHSKFGLDLYTSIDAHLIIRLGSIYPDDVRLNIRLESVCPYLCASKRLAWIGIPLLVFI